MILGRLSSLMTALLCLCLSLPVAVVAQQAAPPAQANGQAQPAQAPQPNKQNPFEAVPQTTEPAKAPPGQRPALEAPKPPEQPKAAPVENTVESIEFRGARRVPQDTLRALISTRKGDNFDAEVLRRDFM